MSLVRITYKPAPVSVDSYDSNADKLYCIFNLNVNKQSNSDEGGVVFDLKPDLIRA